MALTKWVVELSQASLLSHQSNWKVKSRAQATEEDVNRKIYQLTFHLAERSVQHERLVNCKNQSKLLQNVNPDLNHNPVSFFLIIVRPWEDWSYRRSSRSSMWWWMRICRRTQRWASWRLPSQNCQSSAIGNSRFWHYLVGWGSIFQNNYSILSQKRYQG